MNIEIAILINKHLAAGVEQSHRSTIKVLDDCIANRLTATQSHEYKCSFHNAGLSLADDAPNYLSVLHAALIVRALAFIDGADAEYIGRFLDDSVDKWEQVESQNWPWFARQVYSQAFEDADMTTYWTIATTVKTGEHIEFTVYSLAFGLGVDIKLLEWEVAQTINRGRFDSDLYGTPCFDNDGFISYPESIKEISNVEFKVLSEYNANIHTFNESEQECDEVSMAMEWLTNESK